MHTYIATWHGAGYFFFPIPASPALRSASSPAASFAFFSFFVIPSPLPPFAASPFAPFALVAANSSSWTAAAVGKLRASRARARFS